MNLEGLLLAAGSGSRLGTPKALVHDADGTSWLRRAVSTLREGDCSRVTVVLGAAAAEAAALLDDQDVTVVVAEDWALGLGESLRTGLAALADSHAVAAVVTLVDLPDVSAEVVRRLVATDADRGTLSRAVYGGEPGHPVVLGRDHWEGVSASASGDRGARDYLAAHDVWLVECGDLASGRDVDHPPAE